MSLSPPPPWSNSCSSHTRQPLQFPALLQTLCTSHQKKGLLKAQICMISLNVSRFTRSVCISVLSCASTKRNYFILVWLAHNVFTSRLTDLFQNLQRQTFYRNEKDNHLLWQRTSSKTTIPGNTIMMVRLANSLSVHQNICALHLSWTFVPQNVTTDLHEKKQPLISHWFGHFGTIPSACPTHTDGLQRH